MQTNNYKRKEQKVEEEKKGKWTDNIVIWNLMEHETIDYIFCMIVLQLKQLN